MRLRNQHPVRYPAKPWLLPPDAPATAFPAVATATADGLLAIGGDLSPARLIAAYRRGIFPWYSAGEPILWWSPAPRMVMSPDQLHLGRSLRKRLRQQPYQITLDHAFSAVIAGCAAPRAGADGTWITAAMIDAYCQLHRLGYAHSVEAWQEGLLVGGLYGIAIGQIFFGESMFSRANDASKIAFAHLVQQLQQWRFALIDCQMETAHLRRFGATAVPREQFLGQLQAHIDQPSLATPVWHLDPSVAAALTGNHRATE